MKKMWWNSEKKKASHRRIGLFEKGEKRPLTVTFLTQQIATDEIRRTRNLIKLKEYKIAQEKI